jgi:hypothetical protein
MNYEPRRIDPYQSEMLDARTGTVVAPVEEPAEPRWLEQTAKSLRLAVS